MLLFELFIPITPRPWTVKKGRQFYNINQSYIDHVRKYIHRHFDKEPYDCPIYCDFVHYMPIPKSISKKRQLEFEQGRVLHMKRPDTTNLNKQMEDCLTGVIYTDDKQVIRIHGLKKYGKSTGTWVRVYEYKID